MEAHLTQVGTSRDRSVKDLVDERFRQKEELALKDIESEYSARLKRAEATLQRRMQEMISSMSESEKKSVLGKDVLHAIEQRVASHLLGLESVLSDVYGNFGDQPLKERIDDASTTTDLLGMLDQAERDLKTFADLALPRSNNDSADSEEVETNVDRASSRLRGCVENDFVEVLKILRDLNATATRDETSSQLHLHRPSHEKVHFPSHAHLKPVADDNSENEIQRLKDILSKLTAPVSVESVIHDEIEGIDTKYLKLIARLSGLIYEIYTSEDLDKVDPVIHNQVLPFILGGPNNQLLEAISLAVDQFLLAHQTEKILDRLVHLEFSKINRYRRYYYVKAHNCKK